MNHKFFTSLLIALFALSLFSSCTSSDKHQGRLFYGNDGNLYVAEDAPCVNCYRLRKLESIDTTFTKLVLPVN